MAYNFFTPNLRKVLSAVFSTTSGHDHDGVNSKAVTTGTPAAGALSADTTGRAILKMGTLMPQLLLPRLHLTHSLSLLLMLNLQMGYLQQIR